MFLEMLQKAAKGAGAGKQTSSTEHENMLWLGKTLLKLGRDAEANAVFRDLLALPGLSESQRKFKQEPKNMLNKRKFHFYSFIGETIFRYSNKWDIVSNEP